MPCSYSAKILCSHGDFTIFCFDTDHTKECDHESVCSDSSWIITPAPTFRVTNSQMDANDTHSLENLLIEHPTMSIYEQVEPEGENGERTEDGEQSQRPRHQEQEVVMMRNRQRYQVAMQLQLPLRKGKKDAHHAKKSSLRVTRKEARRLNMTLNKSGRRKQTLHVKKCSFVAGHRRC